MRTVWRNPGAADAGQLGGRKVDGEFRHYVAHNSESIGAVARQFECVLQQGLLEYALHELQQEQRIQARFTVIEARSKVS